jgi:putative oxidoreductase
MADAVRHVAVAAPIAAPASGHIGRALLLIGRLALGGIFVFAAYSKLHFGGAWHLRDYHFFFAMAINSYNMLPLTVVQWMARILPWLELVLGALLILGIGLRWASSAITLLLLVFMGALARAAMLGLEINCGCFGYSSQKPTTELFHDSGLLILGLAVTIGAFLTQRARRLPAQTASPE